MENPKKEERNEEWKEDSIKYLAKVEEIFNKSEPSSLKLVVKCKNFRPA